MQWTVVKTETFDKVGSWLCMDKHKLSMCASLFNEDHQAGSLMEATGQSYAHLLAMSAVQGLSDLLFIIPSSVDAIPAGSFRY